MVVAPLVGGGSGMSTTQPRTLACGAAIGGGAGSLGGYAYEQYEKSSGRL